MSFVLYLNRNIPVSIICSAPPNPSQSGYSKGRRPETKVVLLFAYVSFCIAVCRNIYDPASLSSSSLTSTLPRWFQHLSLRQSRIYLEWLQLLADSPISNFTTTPQRVGTIINISRCSWIDLAPIVTRCTRFGPH